MVLPCQNTPDYGFVGSSLGFFDASVGSTALSWASVKAYHRHPTTALLASPLQARAHNTPRGLRGEAAISWMVTCFFIYCYRCFEGNLRPHCAWQAIDRDLNSCRVVSRCGESLGPSSLHVLP